MKYWLLCFWKVVACFFEIISFFKFQSIFITRISVHNPLILNNNNEHKVLFWLWRFSKLWRHQRFLICFLYFEPSIPFQTLNFDPRRIYKTLTWMITRFFILIKIYQHLWNKKDTSYDKIIKIWPQNMALALLLNLVFNLPKSNLKFLKNICSYYPIFYS